MTTIALLALSAQAWAIATLIIWGLNGQFLVGLICCGISLVNAALALANLMRDAKNDKSSI